MKTIYNEKKYAERMLIKKKIDKRNGRTLAILCKYYFFEKNKNKKQIVKLLSKFLDETDGTYDRELLHELVDKYTNEKMKPIDINHVKITLNEIATILSRESEDEQRLMFSILVSYKFKNEKCKTSDKFSCFIGNNKITSSFDEYFKDVKMKPTKDNKVNIMGNLVKDGLILLDVDKQKTLELTYVDENSPVALLVEWENDIWVDLEIYKGSKQYKRCECCGDVIKSTKKKHGDVTKYCSDGCKKEMSNRQKQKYKKKAKNENA